jgi:hypothetical protein
MIEIVDILILIFAHFWADFVVQTRSMAKMKSKSVKYLTLHVLAYSLMFLAILFVAHPLLMITGYKTIILFVSFNFVMHWMTDYVSSKVSSACHVKHQETKDGAWEHLFWVVIGFDQLIHMVTLFLSYYSFNQ